MSTFFSGELSYKILVSIRVCLALSVLSSLPFS